MEPIEINFNVNAPVEEENMLVINNINNRNRNNQVINKVPNNKESKIMNTDILDENLSTSQNNIFKNMNVDPI